MENDICYLVARGLSRDEAAQFVARLRSPPTLSIASIVETLERCKHEHEQGGYDGLDACLSRDGRHECDCGADETNAKLDQAIAEIKKHAAQAAQWREMLISAQNDNVALRGQVSNLMRQDSPF